MTERINFETSKLLQQKGYNEPCKKVYNTHGQLWDSHYSTMNNNDVDSGAKCTAPTIAEGIMWLYEKCEIWIQVSLSRYGKFYCNILKKENTKSLDNPISWEMQVQLNDYNSPTEAYEAAIIHSLNLI